MRDGRQSLPVPSEKRAKGFEPSTFGMEDRCSSNETTIKQVTFECGELGVNHVAHSCHDDPDLIAVITSWATLPAAIKVGIMAMVGVTKSHALKTCVNTSVNKNSCS